MRDAEHRNLWKTQRTLAFDIDHWLGRVATRTKPHFGGDNTLKPSRRNILAMTAGLPAAATLSIGARAETTSSDSEALSLAISQKLFGDDGLARPVPDAPTKSDLAVGLDRTLVLGGGGEYYVAWYCGFFHGLYEQRVDLDIAEMVIGTSAGAHAGAT